MDGAVENQKPSSKVPLSPQGSIGRNTPRNFYPAEPVVPSGRKLWKRASMRAKKETRAVSRQNNRGGSGGGR